MSQTPEIYIAGVKMSQHAAGDRPVLDGLAITYGAGSSFDLEEPSKLNLRLMIRKESVNLGFLRRGVTVAVLGEAGATFFCGRITALTASPSASVEDGWEYQITAAGFLADLQTYDIGPIRWAYTTDANVTLDRLRGELPGGWTLTGSGRWPEWGTSPLIYRRENWLKLLDRTLRGQAARRYETTTFTPAGGLKRRLTIAPERPAHAAQIGGKVIRVPAANLKRGVTWEQSPEDLITDVKLTAYSWHSTYYTDDSGRRYPDYSQGCTGYEIAVEKYVNTRELQSNAGNAQVDMEVDFRLFFDTPSGINVEYRDENPDPFIPQQVRDILAYHLNDKTPWRPTSVEIADSRLMSAASVLDLLDVTRRHLAYLIIDDLPATNPTHYGRVEAHVIGATATWDGKKSRWNFNLTLGRQTSAGNALGAM